MKAIMCEALDGLECGAPAAWMVWGCCEYYRYAMCNTHADLAVREEWGRSTTSCDPMDIEPIDEYMERSNGYGYEEYR